MQSHWQKRDVLSENENISGTINDAAPEVKRLCAYIEAESWEAGSPPFCDAPARPGSSYCARHAGRCACDVVVPDEAEPSYPLFEERDEDTDNWAASLSPRRPRCDDDDAEGGR